MVLTFDCKFSNTHNYMWFKKISFIQPNRSFPIVLLVLIESNQQIFINQVQKWTYHITVHDRFDKKCLRDNSDQCYHIYSCLKSTSTLCYKFQCTNILWFIQYHLFGMKIWPHVGYYRFLFCFCRMS